MEIRATNIKADNMKLIGSVAFNSVSRDLGGFVEVIKPTSFSDSLASGEPVKAIVEHNHDLLLGKTTSNTLELSENATELEVTIHLSNKIQAHVDLYEQVKRRDLESLSFGFVADVEEWDHEASPPIRYISKARLYEITVCAVGAYAANKVDARSLLNSAIAQTSAIQTLKAQFQLLELI
jgi:HK97 family phage prohead protease